MNNICEDCVNQSWCPALQGAENMGAEINDCDSHLSDAPPETVPEKDTEAKK